MSYLKSNRNVRHKLASVALCGLCIACGASSPVDAGDASGTDTGKADDPDGDATTASSRGSSSTGEADSGETSTGLGSAATGSETSTGEASSAGGSSTGEVSSTTKGVADCTKTVVLMGYWPPTNEMLRPFSTDPEQNPEGWSGENWRGLGFDVYAFFPEFPPDGDPSNDPIGAPGSVGEGDLQVDYQDTSADFWEIVDTLQPHIVITHSRGGGIGWELEAIEGGHGSGGADPAFDWISDGFGGQTRPTQETVDPRSWTAMNTYRDVNAQSLLPLEEIEAAADELGSTSVQIDAVGTSGNYLSGFLGLHGIFYAETTPHAVAGGHIHVGIGLPVEDARALSEASLEAVLLSHPAETLACPRGG